MKSTLVLQEHLETLTNIEHDNMQSVMAEVRHLRKKALKQQTEIAELKRQAFEDEMTGLYNRRAFEEELTKTLSYHKRYNRPGAVLVVDVDAFKSINDTLGHQAGDALLKHISKLLLTHTRDSDFVSRIGGDEFCVLLREVSQLEANRKANHLMNVIANTPCSYEGRDIHISVSIGSCNFKDAGDKNELLHKADKQMYKQKAASGRSVR